MFYWSNIHRYWQWFLWFTLCFGLVAQSTAFALIIPSENLPSGGLPETSQKNIALPGRENYPEFTLQRGPVTAPTIKLQTFETLPTPDSNPEAPWAVKNPPSVNESLSNEELKSLILERSSVLTSSPTLRVPTESPQNDVPPSGGSTSRASALAMPDVTQDMGVAQLIQSKKDSTIVSEGWSPDNQAALADERILASDIRTVKKHVATAKDVDGKPVDRFDFMVNFTDISDSDDSEASAVDKALNCFYNFLSQLIPSGETQEFHGNSFIPDRVGDDRLTSWLQQVMVSDDISRKPVDGAYNSYFMAFPARNENPAASNPGDDARNPFNPFFYRDHPTLGTVDPLAGNYDNGIRRDLSFNQTALTSTGPPDRHNEQTQYSDSDTAKRSFFIKFINYLSNALKTFKEWLHDLFGN